MIDDDEDDRNLFENALTEIDPAIQFDFAVNGKDALRYLNAEHNAPPDYIFLDLRMPGITGKQCLMEIRKSRRLAEIPVIVYTTSRDVLESKELKMLGASHFMSKPTSPEEVYYMISFVLGEKFS